MVAGRPGVTRLLRADGSLWMPGRTRFGTLRVVRGPRPRRVRVDRRLRRPRPRNLGLDRKLGAGQPRLLWPGNIRPAGLRNLRDISIRVDSSLIDWMMKDFFYNVFRATRYKTTSLPAALNQARRIDTLL
jgi:hypothetical protein